jgi:hypothetical protein
MRNPSRRRPKPITTAHQRQLKQASNRRYYQRQNSKRGDPIQIFPLPLLESEANDIATDIEFQKGDAGRVLRKFGSRALVGYVAADIVREQLKLKKK